MNVTIVVCVSFFNKYILPTAQRPCTSDFKLLPAVVFAARRYSSAVYAVVVCLSVCHKPAMYQNA